MVAVAIGLVAPAVIVLLLTAVSVRAVIVRAESHARIGTEPIVPHPTPSWADPRTGCRHARRRARRRWPCCWFPRLLAAPLALVNPWGFVSYSAATVPEFKDSVSIMSVATIAPPCWAATPATTSTP